MDLIQHDKNSQSSASLPSAITQLCSADRYLISLRSKNSRRTMRSALNSITRLLGKVNYRDVSFHSMQSSDVDLIIEMLSTKSCLSPTTINLYLSAMKGVFKHCWKTKQISYEDYLMLKTIDEFKGSRIKRNKVILLKEQVLAIIEYAESLGTIKGARDTAIISILGGCGLRRDEVSCLTIKDYSSSRALLYVHGKGNKERIADIPKNAKDKLDVWLSLRGEHEGAIFCRISKHDTIFNNKTKISGQAVYNVLESMAVGVGIKKIHPHAMRHYFGTTLIRKGVDIVTVRDMLGHESVSTTEKYIDESSEARKNAVELVDI